MAPRAVILVALLLIYHVSAEVIVDATLPVTRTTPVLDLVHNSFSMNIRAPFLDSTWQKFATPYTGSYSLVPNGCRTLGGLNIDLYQERTECNGFEKIDWVVRRQAPVSCTGAVLFQATMRTRLNQYEHVGVDHLYEVFPTSVDVKVFTLPALNPEVMRFTRAVLDCPTEDPAWAQYFDTHLEQRTNLLGAGIPFVQCHTNSTTGAYMLRSTDDTIPGASRQFIAHMDPWVPGATEWTSNFKETFAATYSYTDMASFDAALKDHSLFASLAPKSTLVPYMSMPASTQSTCQTTDSRALTYIALGSLKDFNTAPATLADLGSCDSIRSAPAGGYGTYGAALYAASAPTDVQFAAIQSNPSAAIPGYWYPLDAVSMVSAVATHTEMFQGRVRHYLDYTVSGQLTKIGACTGANGAGVLSMETIGVLPAPIIQSYQFVVDVVTVPATPGGMPFTHYPVTYRFTVNRDSQTYTLAQVYDTNDDIDAKVLQTSVEPCSPLEPQGDWNVTKRVQILAELKIRRRSLSEVVGVSRIVATRDVLDRTGTDVLPDTGCYGFPDEPSVRAISTEPQCVGDICTVKITGLRSACFYPDPDGKTFYAQCPNIQCSPAIYSSSLGVYRFGVELLTCASTDTWGTGTTCKEINAGDPRVIIFNPSPEAVPFAPAQQLLSQFRAKVVVDVDNTTSNTYTDGDYFLSNGVVAIAYTREQVARFVLELPADILPYLDLGLKQLDMCYLPIERIREMTQPEAPKVDCKVEPGVTFVTVWKDGGDSALCAAGASACFVTEPEGDRDYPFKGWSKTMGPYQNANCNSQPGCDAGAIRISRLIDPALFGMDIVQTETKQTHAILFQLEASYDSLARVQQFQRRSPLRTLRAYAVPSPRLMADTTTVSLTDTGVFVVVTHEKTDAEIAQDIGSATVVWAVVGAMGVFFFLLLLRCVKLKTCDIDKVLPCCFDSCWKTPCCQSSKPYVRVATEDTPPALPPKL